MAEGDGQAVAWLDELVAKIRDWHEQIIETSGAAGEHTARLLACCARPFQGGVHGDYFPSDVEKGAALFHGIISGHPFVDGNKRTATLATTLYLIASGVLDNTPSPLHFRMLGELAVAVASSRTTVEEVADWLERILGPFESL
ncbi:MAG: Fic family protein [Dehalococcoidia bacterium]